jgi:hypothetical protein
VVAGYDLWPGDDSRQPIQLVIYFGQNCNDFSLPLNPKLLSKFLLGRWHYTQKVTVSAGIGREK